MHDAPRLAIFALETEILARVYEHPGELRQSDFDGAQQPIVKGMVRRGALARDRYGFLSVARNGEQYPQGSIESARLRVIGEFMDRVDAILRDNKTRAVLTLCIMTM